jgi:hypothetical protein
MVVVSSSRATTRSELTNLQHQRELLGTRRTPGTLYLKHLICGIPYDDIVEGALRVGGMNVGLGDVGYF